MPIAIALARAASFADANGWISVDVGLPTCSSKPDSFGVEVLIHPKGKHGDSTMFYGRRNTKSPAFYKGGAIDGSVRFWQYLPNDPVDAPKLLPGMAARPPHVVATLDTIVLPPLPPTWQDLFGQFGKVTMAVTDIDRLRRLAVMQDRGRNWTEVSELAPMPAAFLKRLAGRSSLTLVIADIDELRRHAIAADRRSRKPQAKAGLPGKMGTQKALDGRPGKLGRIRGESSR